MSELEKKRSETPQQAEAPFKSGEKGFAVFWLLFGGFFFTQSLQLYQKHPGLDSCAALPLFVTGVIVLCSIINLIGDRAKPSDSQGRSPSQVVRQTLQVMFPADVVSMMALLLLYCLALNAKLGFYPTTVVFLWVSMSWYMRKGFYSRQNGFDKKAFLKIAAKNLLWTAISILFILVVFTFLFNVVLP